MANLIIVGEHDEGTLRQVNTLKNRPELQHVFLMADGHLGYQSMPIGGVTISDHYIAPGGAGFDIGCGNWTGKTELRLDMLNRGDIAEIGQEIKQEIAIGLGQAYGTWADLPWLNEVAYGLHHINGLTPELIKNQFGSVGAGNHYIDLMTDEDEYIWIALHFGSRKLGHSVAKHYLDLLGAKDGMYSEPVFLDTESGYGQEYLHDMEIAGEYAMQARRHVGAKIATQILHGTVGEVVENHHNYIWKENHFGRDVWVTRKGATPVHPGVPVFIGGSMGTDSVIVEANDCQNNNLIFHSAPHGAGRVMGRAQATGNKNRAPRVTQDMMDEAVDAFGVVRIGGGVDESPHVYRNLLEDVIPYYPHLTVKHVLRPILAVMAPPRPRRWKRQ